MHFLNDIFSGFSENAKEFVKNTFRPILDLLKKLFNITNDTNAFLMFLGLCLLITLILVLVIIFIVKKVKACKKLKEKRKENNNLLKEDLQTPQEIEIKDNENSSISTTKENDEVKQDKQNEVNKQEKAIVPEIKEEQILPKVVLGKFEVFPVGEIFLYRLKASNGEILVVSEMYKTLKGALSAIETVKRNIEVGTVSIYEDKHGLFQFKLFATNKRLLANSAYYSTYQSCENASESFKKFGLISPISILEKDPEDFMEEIKLMSLTAKKNGKLEIVEIDDEYEFNFKACNGVLLCKSSTYKTKNSLTNAIAALKEACTNGKFYVVKDKNETYQFKLYSASLRCVVVGEAYKTKNQAISAANSVSSFAELAEVVDKTIKENV